MAVGTGPDVRGSDLIDGEPDGLHVHPFLPEQSPVLLHEGDDHAADVVIVVRVLQRQLELWVGPEGVWGSEVTASQGQPCDKQQRRPASRAVI